MAPTKVKAKEKVKLTRVGSRKVREKVSGCWTEENIMESIHEIHSTPGANIRGVAKKYGVNECTIRWRIKKKKV